jgi:hypothetical protein
MKPMHTGVGTVTPALNPLSLNGFADTDAG